MLLCMRGDSNHCAILKGKYASPWVSVDIGIMTHSYQGKPVPDGTARELGYSYTVGAGTTQHTCCSVGRPGR